MLKITGLSEKTCFLTGSKEDVVAVKFADGSFTGTLSWSSLLGILKRKAVETPKDKNKLKRELEKSVSVPIPETEGQRIH